MNLFNKIFGSKTEDKPEKRGLGDSPGMWTSLSHSSMSGATVSEDSAMRISAVYACVRVISESVASLSIDLYERSSDGSREKVSSPLSSLLKVQPNSDMSAYSFLEAMTTAAVFNGNAFAQIVRAVNGKIIALRPMCNSKVQIRQEPSGGRIFFMYEGNRFEQDEVIHVKGPSRDGVVGMNPIEVAREAMGLSISAEKHGSKFFDNAFSPSGFLLYPSPVAEEARINIAESLSKNYSGDNAHKVAVFDNGADYKPMALSNNDAQFLETRKFQLNEIARMFRVPPHMIGDLERATFSNVEQQAIDFVVYTLRPWLRRWEDELNRKLVAGSNKFIEFNVASLLRGDTASRFNSYAIGRQNGWLSANDIRKMENMNPIDGGDIYLSPMNMVSTDKLDETTPGADGADGVQDTARAFTNAVQNAAERCALKASAEMRKDNFDPKSFESRHVKYVTKALAPAFKVGEDLGLVGAGKVGLAASALVKRYLAAFDSWTTFGEGTIEDLLQKENEKFNTL